jgi:hypothetical protein
MVTIASAMKLLDTSKPTANPRDRSVEHFRSLGLTGRARVGVMMLEDDPKPTSVLP